VLQCETVKHTNVHGPAILHKILPQIQERCSVLRCVAVCCSVLQCVAASDEEMDLYEPVCVVGCCGVLRGVAVCCSFLQCQMTLWMSMQGCVCAYVASYTYICTDSYYIYIYT